jgi:putative DNA primase/helicase
MTERRRLTYFTPLLSTANKSVVEVLRGLGFKRGFEPYIDRLMDIPPPDGSSYFFEGMRGDDEFRAFGNALRKLARENHGLAGPYFLHRLVNDLKDGRDRLQAFCHARQERFWKAAEDIVSKTGRNLTRAKNRYSTIYVAGCLAISYGILPFDESELLDAVWTWRSTRHRPMRPRRRPTGRFSGTSTTTGRMV